jgi:predicted nuclease of restriction endonuclease-like (RecB) superfamily
VIAQFSISLPSPPSVSFTPLDWQDDAYFTRLFRELPWTHFIELIRMDDQLKRAFYEVEALRNRWSVRELKRQINSLLYERVGLSRDQEGVLALAKEGELVTTPTEMVRDPYVFEFLGLKRAALYTESHLEQALLDHLQEFLMEMGKGFCFVARQRRVTFDNEHYYIDLLLYNRRLKCLVAIDLMLGRFRHEYAGAMNFYLNYLKAEEMEEGENPPIGLMLCSEKNETHTVAPAILWIDEMEKALAHGGLDGGTSTRVFGTILTWMQEKTAPCFVVGTANAIEHLPPEVLRKGRFDEIFFLDLPTLAERQEIFTVHLRKRKRLPQDFDPLRLARESEGYVGAEIEQAIIDAMYVGFNAGREFTTDDISAALRRQVPLSISQRETIGALRNWLREGRAQSASFQEIREAEQQFVPLQLDVRG